MGILPSGLPDLVDDLEELARFLTQSNQFKVNADSSMAKPVAFLPLPQDKNTSVFRCGDDANRLRQIWQTTTNNTRPLKAVALCKTEDVRKVKLDVIASEPPDAHANIEGWPWLENDLALQKAKQKEIAMEIAQKARVVVV